MTWPQELGQLLANTPPGQSADLGDSFRRLSPGDRMRCLAERYAVAKAKRGETEAEIT
jgi:hypothetical protein